ncbi:hypothetical protein [Mycobacteroides abscessus]|uniref:hypothetical protein n=1 Tax=Mycobacteroides abscessus TaxID=36809 RepID=UPI0005E8D30C|nr:hypothetical protein [Mycobacteroides abscessus]CPR79488.1 Uncharacterised protein [Mycobacteroides abscessus]CPR88604.1 Uncharacterised protein [Mycobacteroides abscessus]CPS43544.1 Uncharacterised protein [Mycobacteroides abscessus]CPV03331.1 Uncharacterised protein [Mycobacteroides abscessus]
MAEVTQLPTGLPSTNALDNLPLQQPLIEAAYAKFTGQSAGALEDPPALDEERTYVVTAKCVEHKTRRRKDAEERLTTTMEIVTMHEQGKAPAKDDSQGSLYDQDEDGGE